MDLPFAYPTGGEYREALFDTRRCFKDPALIGGTVTLDSLGLPKPISGASASVFTIQNHDGRRWAVKCFTRFVNDQDVRYRRISEALRTVSKPWRVEFEYLHDGVFCRGEWFPALKMEWIEASGLIPFIESHLWESRTLANLAAKFAQMVKDLSILGIAHGDLQHGNLLVTPSGELKLIDYDGMFVPGLANLGACEKGHVNYQSPARTMSSWGPYLDNFSAWIIYASLVALTIDPTIWLLLHDQGDEALLFHKDDFVDHRGSRALRALAQNPQPGLQAFGSVMNALWTPDIRAIPALNPAELPAPRERSSVPVSPAATLASANGPPSSIPDWITQAQVGTQAQATALGAQGGPSWIAGHLPALPPVDFNPSGIALRVLAILSLIAIVAAGLSTVTGALSDAVAGVASCLFIFLFIAITIILFRRMPEWRTKREKLISLKECRAESSRAAREIDKLERGKRGVDNREKKAVEKITKQADKARVSEQKELAGVDTRLAANIQKLAKEKYKLQSSESAEIGNALRLLQQQHITTFLRTSAISSAKIPGIGPSVVSSLAANGITSAADFAGLYYRTGPRGGQQTFIRLHNGAAVHPSGVGAKKAHDLDNWRRRIEGMARATQPSSLPSAQAQAIRTTYAQRRQALADQEQAQRVRAADEQKQVRQRWIQTHTAISAELAATRQAFAQERARADLRLAAAQKQAGTAIWQRELAEREMVPYRSVRYRRYIAGLLRT